MKYKLKKTETSHADEEQIADAICKAKKLPADMQMWFNGFAEGLIRGWNNEHIVQQKH